MTRGKGRDVLEEKPDDAPALSELGQRHRSRNEVDEARREFQLVIDSGIDGLLVGGLDGR